MGPTWVLAAPDWPHVGPMNLAIRDVITSRTCDWHATGERLQPAYKPSIKEPQVLQQLWWKIKSLYWTLYYFILYAHICTKLYLFMYILYMYMLYSCSTSVTEWYIVTIIYWENDMYLYHLCFFHIKIMDDFNVYSVPLPLLVSVRKIRLINKISIPRDGYLLTFDTDSYQLR